MTNPAIKKQPAVSPDNFLNLCTEAQGFFAKKSSDQDEVKKLFDKCRELNDTRMIIVQGFMTDDNGSIAPQFASSNLEKAYRYFMNPEELVELANTARIISDKFIEEVLV